MSLFAYESKLHFNEIRRKLRTRSNKLAYWLKKLNSYGLIVKDSEGYSLAESAEHLVPYLSATRSALPVVLVHIGNSKKAFLYKRSKRPYKDLLALPGGRLLIGESPEQAAERIMKNKHNIKISKPKIKDILIEHVKRKKFSIYSFFLIIIKALPINDLNLIDIEKSRKQIIKSDYKVLHLKDRIIKLESFNSTQS